MNRTEGMNINHKNRVSVILPVFNAESYIDMAIQSVLKQTFENFELIIVDDKSTDNTIEIVRKFKDSRITIVKHDSNKGPSAARNTGIQTAVGTWLAFIDADDMWHRERLSKLLVVAEQYPKSFVGSDIMICLSGSKGELIPWESVLAKREFKDRLVDFPTSLDFLKNSFDVKPICPLQIVRKHNLRFREEVRGPEWLEFILNLYRYGLSLVVLNESLYFYRLTPGSLSSSYREVSEEVENLKHLASVEWLDELERKELTNISKTTKQRLFANALREKRWIEAVRHGLYCPSGIWHFFKRLPKYMFQKYYIQRHSKDG